jgi:conjugative transfer signal peptidase TraF
MVVAMVLSDLIVALLFIGGYLTLNVTPSVPVGLWWIIDSKIPFRKEDYVVVDVERFAGYGAYQNYPFRRSAWGTVVPFIKRIAGVAGDTVTGDGEGIRINGQLLKDSGIVSRDRNGNGMKPFPLPITLINDQLWLASQSPLGFDSRYLGTARVKDCRKAIPLIIFNILFCT